VATPVSINKVELLTAGAYTAIPEKTASPAAMAVIGRINCRDLTGTNQKIICGDSYVKAVSNCSSRRIIANFSNTCFFSFND
jgi:hypothetical protein